MRVLTWIVATIMVGLLLSLAGGLLFNTLCCGEGWYP